MNNLNIRVSVFDDNDALRESLYYLISGTPGFAVSGLYPDCNNVLESLRKAPAEVILMDIDMPGLTVLRLRH